MINNCPNCGKYLVPSGPVVYTKTYIKCTNCNHIYGYETPDLVMTDIMVEEVNHGQRDKPNT